MAKKKVIWMFSGQGSQYYNMGRELFEQEGVFRDCLNRCDKIVRPWIDDSLIEIIYDEKKSSEFNDTFLTHPAICAVQYSMAQTLRARGHVPDFLLGYSLGEITASMVAGVVSLETGFELLHEHAGLMASSVPPGGMMAIFSATEVVEQTIHNIPDLWIAARNTDKHLVLSGSLIALDQLEQQTQEIGIITQRLPVRCAFHSPMMDSAEEAFRSRLQKITAKASEFEIISATTGAVSSGLDSLWDATRKPVEFMHTIRRLENEHEGIIYADLGPSGTMGSFVKYIGISAISESFSTITPFGREEIQIRAYEDAIEASYR